MRCLSFAIVTSLLLSHFATAIPPPTKGPENASEVDGKDIPRARLPPTGFRNRIRFGDDDPYVGRVVAVQVKEYQTKDASGNPLSERILEAWHGAAVLCTKEYGKKAKKLSNPTLLLAPITHGGQGNPKFVPDLAKKYVTGPDDESKIHIGKPFEVPKRRTKLNSRFKDWVVFDLKGLRNAVRQAINDPTKVQDESIISGKDGKSDDTGRGGRNPISAERRRGRRRGRASEETLPVDAGGTEEVEQ